MSRIMDELAKDEPGDAIRFIKSRRFPAGTNIYEVIDWIGDPEWGERWLPRPPGGIALKTPEGLEWAVPGDWIVRGEDGLCFPVEGDR